MTKRGPEDTWRELGGGGTPRHKDVPPPCGPPARQGRHQVHPVSYLLRSTLAGYMAMLKIDRVRRASFRANFGNMHFTPPIITCSGAPRPAPCGFTSVMMMMIMMMMMMMMISLSGWSAGAHLLSILLSHSCISLYPPPLIPS